MFIFAQATPGILEILAQLTGIQRAVLVGIIWGVILIANAVAKGISNRPSKTPVGMAADILRRIMRTIGAEPPLKDKD